MVIVEVETVVIHWFDFDILLPELRLWDEIERPQQMHHFLKYDGFRLSIWQLTINLTLPYPDANDVTPLYPFTYFVFGGYWV